MNQWSLLFIAPLLAYSSPLIGGASFSAHYLLVPLAALVGGRFALTGVIFMALGGLVFVTHAGGRFGSIGGNPSLYLIALAVAAIAASPRPLADWRGWPSDSSKAAWIAFLAPFTLVLEAGTAYMRVPETGLWFAFRFPLATLGYFLLFVMGMRGVRLAPPLGGVALAAALTWAMERMGWFTHAPAAFFVSVDALPVLAAVAALAVFSAGRALGAKLHGGAMPLLWRRPVVTVAALVLLWFAVEVLAMANAWLPNDAAMYLTHSAVVLPLAAFMAGLLGGPRGVVLVSALVPALMLAWIAVLWTLPNLFGHATGPGAIHLEAPFVAAAWAVLGARLAHPKRSAGKFHLPRYPAYVVLLAAAAIAMFGTGTPTTLVLAVLFVGGGLAAYFAGARLGRAMAAAGHPVTQDRWVSFTALVLLAVSVAVNWSDLIFQMRHAYYRFPLLHAIYDPLDAATVRNFLGASISPELAALMVAFAAIVGLALVSMLASLLSSVPKVLGDARAIGAYLHGPRGGSGAA